MDTAGGWPNHLRRIARWRDRTLQVLDDADAYPIEDAADFVLAYFVWCHSLRDWLIKSQVIQRTKLDHLLDLYPCWKPCRDIANRCRHFELTINPVDKYWSMRREYDVWAKADGRSEQHRILIFFDGRIFLAKDLVNQCFEMWSDITGSIEGGDTQLQRKKGR